MAIKNTLLHIALLELFATIACLKLTKTEEFSQSTQNLIDKQLNITRLFVDTNIGRPQFHGIKLCFSYASCFAVSYPYNGYLYFAGYDQLPGEVVSTTNATYITWIAMQSMQNETETNYALYADTYSLGSGDGLDNQNYLGKVQYLTFIRSLNKG